MFTCVGMHVDSERREETRRGEEMPDAKTPGVAFLYHGYPLIELDPSHLYRPGPGPNATDIRTVRLITIEE